MKIKYCLWIMAGPAQLPKPADNRVHLISRMRHANAKHPMVRKVHCMHAGKSKTKVQNTSSTTNRGKFGWPKV